MFSYPAACVPGFYTSATNNDADQAVEDPHHFILFQHGVMGYAGDFENVITDLFVHHDVTLHEAYEAAVEKERRQRARGQRHGQRNKSRHSRTQRASVNHGHRGEEERGAPSSSSTAEAPAFPVSSAETADATKTPLESEAKLRGRMTVQENEGTPFHDELSLSSCDGKDDGSEEDDEELFWRGKDRREAQRRAARREEYKNSHFSLDWTYPFNRHGRLYQTGNLVCFAPGSNNFLGTGSGTLTCARRMLEEFVPVFAAWLDRIEAERREEAEAEEEEDEDEATQEEETEAARFAASGYGPAPTESSSGASFPQTVSSPSSLTPLSTWHHRPRSAPRRLPICFSCVGHSFGGLILREFLYLLCVDTSELASRDATLYAAVLNLRLRLMRLHVNFENFLTVASPHCGTTECLWWPIYVGAWCLAKLRLFDTYGELIVSDSEALLMKRLVDGPHITALKLFRRRTLFANTHRDLLVGFGTSALIFENVPDDHTKAKGYGRGSDVPCASAFESDDTELSAAIYLPAHRERGAVSAQDDHTTSLPSQTDRSSAFPPAVATHTLFDIWEYHHTRHTTTLAPVDPLTILAPAAAAAADALTQTVAVAAAAAAAAAADAHQNSNNDPVAQNTTARGPTQTDKVAPPEVASPRQPHDEQRCLNEVRSSQRSSGSSDGCDDGDDDSVAATGPWYHYERVFPDPASSAANATSAASGGVAGNVSSSPTLTVTRHASFVAGGALESVVDPSIPPPTLQFPLSKIISPEQLRDKLRAALSPSLSATVVKVSHPEAKAAQRKRTTSAEAKRRHHRDDTSSSSHCRMTSSGRQQEASRGAHGVASVPPSSAGAPTHQAASALLADGDGTADTTSGSTWLWPTTASLLGRLTSASGTVQGTSQTAASSTTSAQGAESLVPSHNEKASRSLASVAVSVLSRTMGVMATRVSALVRRLRGAQRTSPAETSLPDASAAEMTTPSMQTKEELQQQLTATTTTSGQPGTLATSPDLPASTNIVTANEFAQRPDESEEDYLRRLLEAHMRSLPRSRLTPRAIAHELRRELDWRVRAVRWNHVIPIAHVASLGNWAWAGTSPNLVKAVAEEIAHIL